MSGTRFVVTDAGPLLALAKIDCLALLFQLYGTVFTTPAVYDETVKMGLEIGARCDVIGRGFRQSAIISACPKTVAITNYGVVTPR